MSADASLDNTPDVALTDAELDALLANVPVPDDAELRFLGLVTDGRLCGRRIVQRAFGPDRLTCGDSCRQRLSRLRRARLGARRPPLTLADDVVNLKKLWFARKLNSGLSQ